MGRLILYIMATKNRCSIYIILRTAEQIYIYSGLPIKVLARRAFSRPMDAHFWKKHKENSPNLLYVYGKT